METLNYTGRKKQWQEIRMWQRYWGYSLEQYDLLPNHLKEVLHNCICEPVKNTSDTQRYNLMKTILSIGNPLAGRETNDPIDLVIREEQKKLAPLTEKQKKDFLSKYQK
jgi:hypothetical protein